MGGGSRIVPIVKRAVFETLTKRILIRTVTLTRISISPPWPSASNSPLTPTLANEMPKRRASTLAEKSTWKW